MYFEAAAQLSNIHFKIEGDPNRDNVFLSIDNYYVRLSECTVAQQEGFPAEADILTKQAQLVAIESATRYQRDRARRYPIDSDPLFFEFQYMEEKSDPGAAAKKTEWLAAVDKIKQDYPA